MSITDPGLTKARRRGLAALVVVEAGRRSNFTQRRARLRLLADPPIGSSLAATRSRPAERSS